MEEIVDWGTPPTFGAVGSGKETCIFLCQGAQGGHGRGANTTTFQQDGDEEGTRASRCRSRWTTWMRCTSSASQPDWRSHFRQPICHGTSARCTFAIRMATFSGSAGDSSPKSRNPRLVLESAAVLSPKLEDASAFERRQGIEIVGIHDQPHILHRQSQDLVLRGRRTGERDQLEHRSASSIRPKAFEVAGAFVSGPRCGVRTLMLEMSVRGMSFVRGALGWMPD